MVRLQYLNSHFSQLSDVMLIPQNGSLENRSHVQVSLEDSVLSVLLLSCRGVMIILAYKGSEIEDSKIKCLILPNP